MYGHRKFVVLIGASEDAAVDLLGQIVADFESNDELLADFPEVVYPIRVIGGIVQKCAGQHIAGARTQVEWGAKELVLPTVKGSAASGSRVKVAGITGRIRGMSAVNPADGSRIRPDLVILDDPQTDESARSPKQIHDRIATINGSILGLAGPGKKIAGFAAVTVIERGDVADQLLDQKKSPEWQGERISLMQSLPTNTKLWEQYGELRATGLREGRGLADATTFYREHKAELDAGAVATWAARYNPDEDSAIQHAQNLRFRDEPSFFAEYQNQPMAVEVDTAIRIVADDIAKKVTNIPRGIVPDTATKLTAFIDVQGTVLYYAVCAFNQDFSGQVIDYGTYPRQARDYFTLREVSQTLAMAKPGVATEAQLYDGLRATTDLLCGRQWLGASGKSYGISRLLIDSGWQTGIVNQFARESRHSAIVLPSKGYGITADRKPYNDYSPEPGMRTGWCWRHKVADRLITYDTNSWKTFVAARLTSAPGEPGAMQLFDASPFQHRMVAAHFASEYPTPTEGMGRLVNVWRTRPNTDNHLWDCLIGCYVAASEQGLMFAGHKGITGKPRKEKRKYQFAF